MEKIGFIGAGEMATSIIEGMIGSGAIEKNSIIISDIKEERVKYFNSLGIKSMENKNLVQTVDVILFSVKPDKIKNVCEEIKDIITEEKLIISIAAGIKINYIENIIRKKIPIVRVMPNTPALVRSGISVYTGNKNVSSAHLDIVKKILSSIGEYLELEEKFFDVVTGLSGSGPSYGFIVINALADGGVKMGLPKDIALKLAAQTILGAAKLILKTGKHPEELKDMVSSPGGTTVEGNFVLEKYGIRAAFIEAVERATLKSSNLA